MVCGGWVLTWRGTLQAEIARGGGRHFCQMEDYITIIGLGEEEVLFWIKDFQETQREE